MSVIKEHTWYALTYTWILAIPYTVSKPEALVDTGKYMLIGA